jgi:hypothetical protein
MVRTASSSRKLLVKSFSLQRKSSSSVSAPTPPPAASSPSRGPVEEDWALSFRDRQELYETVTLDPSTSWMLDQTSYGTTKSRIGIAGPTFDLLVHVPKVTVQFLSEEERPIFHAEMGELKTRFENHGQFEVTTLKANRALWSCDVTLASVTFAEDREDVFPRGSFSTLAQPLTKAPLIQLQLSSAYLGQGTLTRLKVVAEIQVSQVWYLLGSLNFSL